MQTPTLTYTNSLNSSEDGFRVALVCMPFFSVATPSIQIGLLTAIAEAAGFQVEPYHLNLHLAGVLSLDRYEALCGHRGHMTGEWLFSVAAFNAALTTDEAYFAAFPDEVQWIRENAHIEPKELSALRHEILPRFIDESFTAAAWEHYSVVGFTSTFQQNVASLALARRIKEAYPRVKIAFGGANMEDVMGPEHLRVFPFIDYVVMGEGDLVFPALLRELAAGRDPNLPGVARRSGPGEASCRQSPPVRDLDALPVPKYDEFFRRARDLGLEPAPQLFFESARGCWWGENNHCTFCGLNGLGMGYRMKSARRVLSELNELSRRYQVHSFEATDTIMSPKYVDTIFAKIAEDKIDVEIFYEVKCNLNIAQLRTMARGGVRRIQPGLESMSTHILQLMKKGTTLLQNVKLLKWCRYYAIRVNWNLLCGFPGETRTDYAEQLEVLKLLSHLEPPSGLCRIWLERFSPYFVERESYGVGCVRPEASYHYVYPDYVDLEKLAYFFDYTMSDVVPEQELYATEAWVGEWRRRWSSGTASDSLTYCRTHDAVILSDQRGKEHPVRYVFDGALGVVYEHCNETARSVKEVLDALAVAGDGKTYSDEEVRATLQEFCCAGLMLTENNYYLSLALPTNKNW